MSWLIRTIAGVLWSWTFAPNSSFWRRAMLAARADTRYRSFPNSKPKWRTLWAVIALIRCKCTAKLAIVAEVAGKFSWRLGGRTSPTLEVGVRINATILNHFATALVRFELPFVSHRFHGTTQSGCVRVSRCIRRGCLRAHLHCSRFYWFCADGGAAAQQQYVPPGVQTIAENGVKQVVVANNAVTDGISRWMLILACAIALNHMFD